MGVCCLLLNQGQGSAETPTPPERQTALGSRGRLEADEWVAISPDTRLTERRRPGPTAARRSGQHARPPRSPLLSVAFCSGRERTRRMGGRRLPSGSVPRPGHAGRWHARLVYVASFSSASRFQGLANAVDGRVRGDDAAGGGDRGSRSGTVRRYCIARSTVVCLIRDF